MSNKLHNKPFAARRTKEQQTLERARRQRKRAKIKIKRESGKGIFYSGTLREAFSFILTPFVDPTKKKELEEEKNEAVKSTKLAIEESKSSSKSKENSPQEKKSSWGRALWLRYILKGRQKKC